MKHITGLGLLCLVAFAFFSCTRDYLEDENNFRLRVPQIANNEISNFYVSFHDKSGKHVYTRKVTAPFQGIDNGVMKFKLLPGSNYTLTCFADYTNGAVSEGRAFSESSAFYAPSSVKHYGDDLYDVVPGKPRYLSLTPIEIYGLDDPKGYDPVEANIDEDTCVKGYVDMTFTDLPDFVTRIDILFKGLGTMLKFEGCFEGFNSADKVYTTRPVTVIPGDIVLPTEALFASCGSVCTGTPGTELPLELEGYFYRADGSVAGVMSFTEQDFLNLSTANRPTDGNGVVLNSLVLRSRETIKLKFKGFFVINVEIEGWKDPEESETNM